MMFDIENLTFLHSYLQNLSDLTCIRAVGGGEGAHGLSLLRAACLQGGVALSSFASPAESCHLMSSPFESSGCSSTVSSWKPPRQPGADTVLVAGSFCSSSSTPRSTMIKSGRSETSGSRESDRSEGLEISSSSISREASSEACGDDLNCSLTGSVDETVKTGKEGSSPDGKTVGGEGDRAQG
eukprot:753712-Hanusia_phi.AAC.4